jgi:hypothetical protein
LDETRTTLIEFRLKFTLSLELQVVTSNLTARQFQIVILMMSLYTLWLLTSLAQLVLLALWL